MKGCAHKELTAAPTTLLQRNPQEQAEVLRIENRHQHTAWMLQEDPCATACPLERKGSSRVKFLQRKQTIGRPPGVTELQGDILLGKRGRRMAGCQRCEAPLADGWFLNRRESKYADTCDSVALACTEEAAEGMPARTCLSGCLPAVRDASGDGKLTACGEVSTHNATPSERHEPPSKKSEQREKGHRNASGR
ncbi:hypothetical protein cyc_02897 [Cyclospora cayetanensis]|uniref:Uncharacterized protein n=1 Tax=Cyclospora cayetanensis TaxID=88456 RepID=A0A1D3D601_9EIME|nr:hypothetical protein cyc_02897 [Cyclospora cayetanensis]